MAARLRWIAWFDLGLTALFILPAIAAAFLGALMALENALFGPARVLAMPDAPWFVFISLTGVLGVVWAIARLIVGDERLVLLDAFARLLVAGVILEALLFRGLPLVFGAFIVTELAGTVAVWRAKAPG